MIYTDLITCIDQRKDIMFNSGCWLHQYPEFSFQETKTSDYILKHYQGKDMDIQVQLKGYSPR